MNKRKLLRSYIEKVLDTYGYIFGGVTSELILKQVNNHNKFAYTGWTMDEVMKELDYMKEIKFIEEIPSYILKEDNKIEGDKRKCK